MKPFNLEEAKAGKKVVTRDGREYKFGAHNPEAKEDRRLVGWIDNEICTHNEGGEYCPLCGLSDKDLFMVEEEVWVNVYERKSGGYEIGIEFETEDEAKLNISSGNSIYLKTILLKP